MKKGGAGSCPAAPLAPLGQMTVCQQLQCHEDAWRWPRFALRRSAAIFDFLFVIEGGVVVTGCGCTMMVFVALCDTPFEWFTACIPSTLTLTGVWMAGAR